MSPVMVPEKSYLELRRRCKATYEAAERMWSFEMDSHEKKIAELESQLEACVQAANGEHQGEPLEESSSSWSLAYKRTYQVRDALWHMTSTKMVKAEPSTQDKLDDLRFRMAYAYTDGMMDTPSNSVRFRKFMGMTEEEFAVWLPTLPEQLKYYAEAEEGLAIRKETRKKEK